MALSGFVAESECDLVGPDPPLTHIIQHFTQLSRFSFSEQEKLLFFFFSLDPIVSFSFLTFINLCWTYRCKTDISVCLFIYFG